MRDSGLILEDPEVSEYIQDIGHRLSSHAEEGQHQFYYFVVRDPAINAFAMPGGFIAINSGLILATRNENELPGVMAHETAHVTQRHIARMIVDQTHAGLVSTAAMLAAILLGATAGRGSPGAMEGAIIATQGAAIQHQINYTRSQEFEADRIGICTMASAGFDPLGMPSFFETLNRNSTDPSRIQADRIPDRSPGDLRPHRRSAQPRRADRTHSPRGFPGLPADARTPAIAGRRSALAHRLLRRTC